MSRVNRRPRPDRPPSGRRVFAWAGLRFRLPSGWETGQLAKDHGWLESEFRTVLEFKTAIVRGRFSFRRHMRQLAQTSPLRLQQMDLPIAWQPYLTAFQTRAFSWQGPRLAGDGLLIYCPDCRRATMLQFYRTGGAAEKAVRTVLASFDDHGQGRGPAVAVYDIHVTVPDTLPLKRFRFESVNCWRRSPKTSSKRPLSKRKRLRGSVSGTVTWIS